MESVTESKEWFDALAYIPEAHLHGKERNDLVQIMAGIKKSWVSVTAPDSFSVKTEPELNLSPPEVLFHNNNQEFIFGRGYPWDIHPDGDKFLMIKPPPEVSATEIATGQRNIYIVVNWIEKLKD